MERAVVPDDEAAIAALFRAGAEAHQLVISTGGTGLTPRDVTPQALARVIDYEVPGHRRGDASRRPASTPLADLSRSLGGVVGRTLASACRAAHGVRWNRSRPSNRSSGTPS